MIIWVYVNAIILFFVWLFVSSGIHKLKQRESLAHSLENAGIGIVRKINVRWVIYTLAFFEQLAVVLLVLPASRAAALGLVCVLCGLYVAYILFMVIHDRTEIHCGCSGFSDELKISPSLLVRNMVLCVLAVIAFMNIHPAADANSLGAWVLAVPVATVIVVFYLCADQMLVNRQKSPRLTT